MYRLVTILNLTSVMLSISSMINLSLSQFPELLFIEFRKTQYYGDYATLIIFLFTMFINRFCNV